MKHIQRMWSISLIKAGLVDREALLSQLCCPKGSELHADSLKSFWSFVKEEGAREKLPFVIDLLLKGKWNREKQRTDWQTIDICVYRNLVDDYPGFKVSRIPFNPSLSHNCHFRETQSRETGYLGQWAGPDQHIIPESAHISFSFGADDNHVWNHSRVCRYGHTRRCEESHTFACFRFLLLQLTDTKRQPIEAAATTGIP